MLYISLIKKSFMANLAYRSEVWLSILGNIVIIFIQVSIWKAVMRSSIVSGMELEDMVTYIIISTTVSTILMTNVLHKVDGNIKSGDIAVLLIKPMRFSLYVFSEEMGRIIFQLTFNLLPTFLIAGLTFRLYAPPSALYMIFFIITVLIALLISFFIGYLVALLAFWFLTTFALEWTLLGIITVFSGSFLPLWFFTPEWNAIANILPFKYLGFIPAAMYMGKIDANDIGQIIFIGFSWIIALVLLVNWLWAKAVRRLVIQGG